MTFPTVVTPYDLFMSSATEKPESQNEIIEAPPPPPSDVQGFCSGVAWKIPNRDGGRITGYDVRLSPSGILLSITESDENFVDVAKEYQQIGAFVQVSNQISQLGR